MKRALALVFTGSLVVVGCKGDGKSANKDKGDNAPSAGKTRSDNGDGAKVPDKQPATPKKPLPADTGKHEGAHQWSIRLGGNKRESARGLAADASGNLYIGGLMGAKETESTATIGPDKLTAEGVDAVVVKLDKTGKPIWARNFGGPGDDIIEAIAASPDGGVVFGGGFGEKLSFADRGVPAFGADDAFIGKYDADGKRLWAKRFGGEAVDNVHSVAVDKAGNVYASGVFRLTASFDDTELASSGQADAYLFSVDGAGKFRWVKKLDGEKNDYGRNVVIAPDGSIYWLVEFSRTATLGPVTLESVGNRDWAVIKLSPAGEAMWGVSYGGLFDDLVFGLAIDPSGDLLVTGAFNETLKIGDIELKAVDESDAFVAKLDGRDGKPLWAKSWGDKREDIGAAVATDRFGNVAVTGMYWNTVDFGGGPLKSNGEKDIFVVKLSPTGDHLWSKHFGGEQVDYARALMFDADSNLLVAGTFYLTANFGGVDLKADDKGESIPTGDMFLVELGP